MALLKIQPSRMIFTGSEKLSYKQLLSELQPKVSQGFLCGQCFKINFPICNACLLSVWNSTGFREVIGKKCMQRSKFNAPDLIWIRGGSYQFMLNKVCNSCIVFGKWGEKKKKRCCKALGWEPGFRVWCLAFVKNTSSFLFTNNNLERCIKDKCKIRNEFIQVSKVLLNNLIHSSSFGRNCGLWLMYWIRQKCIHEATCILIYNCQKNCSPALSQRATSWSRRFYLGKAQQQKWSTSIQSKRPSQAGMLAAENVNEDFGAPKVSHNSRHFK